MSDRSFEAGVKRWMDLHRELRELDPEMQMIAEATINDLEAAMKKAAD